MTHWKDCLDPAAPAGRYLPWREVARATSISRTTAWRLQRLGEFPRPYPISPGRVGYLETEVEAWKTSRRTAPPHPATQRTATAAPPVPVAPAPPARGSSAPEPRPTQPRDPEPPRHRRQRRSEHAKFIAQQMRFDF